MKHLHLDIETYSDVDLSASGVYRYASDPSTKILLLAYSYDYQPVRILDLANGDPIPDWLFDALDDPTILKFAHNAEFERTLLKAKWQVECDPAQWLCTMVWARGLGLPGALSTLSGMLNLPSDKAKLGVGTKLITKFCTPKKSSSNEDLTWELFKEYCIRDVEAEIEVHKRIKHYLLPKEYWDLWHLDQKINHEGIPINRSTVALIQRFYINSREETYNKAKLLTQLDNPNSRAQLLDWLNQQGIEVPDLRSATVRDLLTTELTDEIKEALQCRQELSKSSIAKYTTLEKSVDHDGRLRGAFNYRGASRTGRWAGRGFQPQNLPRPSLSDESIDIARDAINTNHLSIIDFCFSNKSEVITSLLRSVIEAPAGKKLVVADYASIETILLAWAAQSKHLLNLFHTGLDPYKDFATKLYNVSYDEVTKQQRTMAKPAVLGCGYLLGAGGLQAYAKQFGMIISEQEAKKQVSFYREKYKDIVDFWDRSYQAMIKAMQNSGKQCFFSHFNFMYDRRFLILTLPSGRSLYYYQPKLQPGKFGNLELTYIEREPTFRISSHPGKITENIIQALSADILGNGLLNVDKTNLTIIGHVHDEIITLADENDTHAEETLIKAMTAKPAWCQDAPIKAEAYSAKYYRK